MLSIKKNNNKYLFFLRGHEIKDFYLFDDDINHLINVFNVRDIKRLEDDFNELLKSQDSGIKYQIKKMGEEGFIKNHIHQFIDPNELKVTINGREVNSDITNKEREEVDIRNIIIDWMVYFLTSLQLTSIDISIRWSWIDAIKNNNYLWEEFDFIVNWSKKDFLQ